VLLLEVRVTEPFLYKIGSKDAGHRWTEVSEHINIIEGFNDNPRDQRSVRERFNKLLDDFKAKMKYEEAASGISPDPLNDN